MGEFVFLFKGDGVDASPEEREQVMPKWMSWMKELREKGYFKSGRPLEDTGITVSGKSRAVTDGPFAESKDLVGGFMIIEANDLNHAVEIAHDCPGLEINASVEVRHVKKLEI